MSCYRKFQCSTMSSQHKPTWISSTTRTAWPGPSPAALPWPWEASPSLLLLSSLPSCVNCVTTCRGMRTHTRTHTKHTPRTSTSNTYLELGQSLDGLEGPQDTQDSQRLYGADVFPFGSSRREKPQMQKTGVWCLPPSPRRSESQDGRFAGSRCGVLCPPGSRCGVP